MSNIKNKKNIEPACISIAAAERETGISKDILRTWERRYGFPSPIRDAYGKRLYPSTQIEKLQRIKRLQNHGLRPGRLLSASEQEIEALLKKTLPRSTSVRKLPHQAFIKMLNLRDCAQLHDALQQHLHQNGLEQFIFDIVAPMSATLSEAWLRGENIWLAERIFTESIQNVLRRSIWAYHKKKGTKPTILLTTLSDEPRGLGLLMSEAALTLAGAYCVSLGTQMPLEDIASAASSGKFDVTFLSFSAAYPIRHVIPQTVLLSDTLPKHSELWIEGFRPSLHHPLPDRVRVIPSLQRIAETIQAWRVTRRKNFL